MAPNQRRFPPSLRDGDSFLVMAVKRRLRLSWAGWLLVAGFGGAFACHAESAAGRDAPDAAKSAPTKPNTQRDAGHSGGSDNPTAAEAGASASGGSDAASAAIEPHPEIDAGLLADGSASDASKWSDAPPTTDGSDPSAPAFARVFVEAVLQTEPVPGDSEDPAIWVDPSDASKSLLIATNKVAAPDGSIVVYDLNGTILQVVEGIDRPNNVDVEDGFMLNGQPTSIAVATERLARRLRVFAIDSASRQLSDVSAAGGVDVLVGEVDEAGAPMGIGLYRRPTDGAVFAIISPKTGPTSDYLWQYRLEDDGSGQVAATMVRRFGNFSGAGEIESIVVDDELGYVYCSDEGDGLHKWYADPDHPDADRELAHFGMSDYVADREGLALYTLDDERGYLISTDQVPGASRFFVYRREGSASSPHDHDEVVAVLETTADATDGLEVSSADFGDAFPHGLMVAMNGGPKNFMLFDWGDVVAAAQSRLSSR